MGFFYSYLPNTVNFVMGWVGGVKTPSAPKIYP